jgi:UDP-N-acetylglucosamine 2-epimerase (non-hydrolysing)
MVPIICSTGQHREMLRQVLDFFSIKLDYDLDLMKPNQKLNELTANILIGLDNIVEKSNPDLIVVQGDTTTSLIGAMTAFYHKIKIAHIEAGLRTNNRYSPFPEEINRVLTTHLSDYHFAPTERARLNLLHEGIQPERIHVVGNTVIDALLMGLNCIKDHNAERMDVQLKHIDFSKHIILVTGHRRESFGKPFKNICVALRKIAEDDRVEIIYPVHLNPNVRKPVFSILGNKNNINLIEPVDYPTMIYLMNKSHIIITDSGGIQEEAPSLKKPVLVVREVTERTEGVEAGVTKIVGTYPKRIIEETFKLINNPREYERMTTSRNPYGDGYASMRIVDILERIL